MAYADPTFDIPVQVQQQGKIAAFGSGSTIGVDTGALVDMSALPAAADYISGANALTAHAGGGQANALPLTASVSRVTTVASANDSVVLPGTALLPAGAAIEITVINAAAANSMNVFPAAAGAQGGVAGGDAINAGAQNAAFALAAGKTATFYCTIAGTWHAILSA